MKQLKPIIISILALVFVLLCSSFVLAEDGWTETTDPNYLGNFLTLMVHAGDSDKYYYKDYSEGSGGSMLEDANAKLSTLYGEKDVYIRFNPSNSWNNYTIAVNWCPNLTNLRTFDLDLAGHYIRLERDQAVDVYCKYFNLYSSVPVNTCLHRYGHITFLVENLDIHDTNITTDSFVTGNKLFVLTNSSGKYECSNVTIQGPFKDYGVDSEGMVFNIPADNVTLNLKNTKILYAHTTANCGGAVCISGKNVHIAGEGETYIQECSASYAGGGIVVYSAGAEISGIHFNQNTATYGGAICVRDYVSDCYIHDCIFENNETSNDGGAIYTNGESISIEKCVFLNNESGDCGGAIHCNDENNHVSCCSFSGNECGDRGGAIYMGYSDGNYIEKCAFHRNHAYRYNENGHAVYLDAYWGIKVSNCRFSNVDYAVIAGTMIDGGGNEYEIRRDFEEWGYFWRDENTGSILSNGNTTIVIAVAAAAVLGVSAIVIKKKKSAQ